jgi:hypothetical protein
MRVWGASVSAGHLVLGTLGWLLLGVPPWFFAGCAVLTLAVTLLAAPLLRRRPGDDGPGGGDGAGGDPSPEPPWWPEFERGFRAYARRGEHTPA